MIETRTLVGMLGSALVHAGGAQIAPELFKVEAERILPVICLCYGGEPESFKVPLLFVEASRPPRMPGPVPPTIAAAPPPCPPEPALERLADPRPLDAKVRRALGQAARERPWACAKISKGGTVLRAYLMSEAAPGDEAALLEALRSVRFDAARRKGRPVTAWHRLTVQFEPKP